MEKIFLRLDYQMVYATSEFGFNIAIEPWWWAKLQRTKWTFTKTKNNSDRLLGDYLNKSYCRLIRSCKDKSMVSFNDWNIRKNTVAAFSLRIFPVGTKFDMWIKKTPNHELCLFQSRVKLGLTSGQWTIGNRFYSAKNRCSRDQQIFAQLFTSWQYFNMC